jgi:hypothetical protein
MLSSRPSRAQSVEAHGVGAGNSGVRIRVLCEQPKGRGGFVILDAGDNKHSAALLTLVGRETDAAEVLRVSRRDSPCCVSVANTNTLVPEERPREEKP